MPRKLALPADKVREDLKAPILELSHQERVKFTQDEIDGYMDKLSRLVEKFLNVDELQKKPILHGFSRLIHNEQVASYNLQMNLKSGCRYPKMRQKPT